MNWEWFVIGFIFAVAFSIGRVLSMFNTIVTVKTPCERHKWNYDEELRRFVCDVCNHIAGETL